jgi:predicted RNA-binding Zn-ribbon protein involved in translation (DUF1610 family)
MFALIQLVKRKMLMTCPNENCGREMTKKDENIKMTEYVCYKCGSLKTVAKIIDDYNK